MSYMYYIGTIKGNIINKPEIIINGFQEKYIDKLLNYCNIDTAKNFNYFSDNPAWLLFYKLTKEDREIINTPFVDDSNCKTPIEYEEFPIICDGKIMENGNSYHLNRVKAIDYSKFKYLHNIDITLLNNIFKDDIDWNEKKKFNYFSEDVKEIINIYKVVSKWILNNEVIYWWQYC